jgi:hypothetical protein
MTMIKAIQEVAWGKHMFSSSDAVLGVVLIIAIQVCTCVPPLKAFFSTAVHGTLTKMMLAREIQIDESLDLATCFALFGRLDKASLLARLGSSKISFNILHH